MALGPGLPNELQHELEAGGHCFAVEKWTYKSMYKIFRELFNNEVPYRYR